MKFKEFEKVIGYESIKTELERIADIITNPEKYRALGVNTPGGVLLFGNPGLGKTLMSKCFIKDLRRTFGKNFNFFTQRKPKSFVTHYFISLSTI